MTEIGKMIREDGIREGKAEGKTEGKSEILIKQLIKKFKTVPNEYREKIKSLPEDAIDIIATDIFEIENLEDLKKYFG